MPRQVVASGHPDCQNQQPHLTESDRNWHLRRTEERVVAVNTEQNPRVSDERALSDAEVAEAQDERRDAPATGIDRRTRVADLPEFLSPQEFGAYLGLSRSLVYELLRRGEIPHRRFGRCIRIPRSAIAR